MFQKPRLSNLKDYRMAYNRPGNFVIFPFIHRLDKKALKLYYSVVLRH
jgi:hypothetical protein